MLRNGEAITWVSCANGCSHEGRLAICLHQVFVTIPLDGFQRGQAQMRLSSQLTRKLLSKQGNYHFANDDYPTTRPKTDDNVVHLSR